MIYSIFAVSLNGIIGQNGRIPWKSSVDMRFFRKMTTGNCVVMGRRTYESVGFLKKRKNIVLTSGNVEDERIIVERSIGDALNRWKKCFSCYDLYFIGGANIYHNVIDQKIPDLLYINVIQKSVSGDTSVKYMKDGELEVDGYKMLSERTEDECVFTEWERV